MAPLRELELIPVDAMRMEHALPGNARKYTFMNYLVRPHARPSVRSSVDYTWLTSGLITNTREENC